MLRLAVLWTVAALAFGVAVLAGYALLQLRTAASAGGTVPEPLGTLIELLVAPVYRVLGNPAPAPASVATSTRVMLWSLVGIGIVTALLAGRAALAGGADSVRPRDPA